MPNDMTLTQSYEEQRNLLTGMEYKRGDTLVTRRSYAYDALGRPLSRDTQYPGKSITHSDTFEHNSRSELIAAQLDDASYTYAYDNIGNRESAQEVEEEETPYEANALNQYTVAGDFSPEFDLAGSQTLVNTSTGIWRITYNAENRPTTFTSDDDSTVVECTYDHMGRRATKKVTTNGEVTLHQRYIYRGYLQIAACDLTRSWQPALWYILWDPTQATATRPLAIQKDGTWYTYGWDLTKNICELYDPNGFIRTTYTYSPYGSVTADGDATQPIQWSSEFSDTELGLVYYNYRYYNTLSGMWISRDPANEVSERNLYTYATRRPHIRFDQLGLWLATRESKGKERRVYLKMSENDTDETLAKEVGLDKETIHIWGKKVCGYIIGNKTYCGYSVPNVWVTANLIDDWLRIGGAFGIAASRLVQWSPKLIVAKNLEDFKDNLTEDLWGFIVYAHGVHLKDSSPDDLGKKKPDGAYYDGDISAITRSGYTVRYRQLDLIEDILAATKGRRIAEAHLMQCYSFRDKYIVQQWRRAAVISKGYTRMNACGFNIPLT